jgi:hypothetical protein
MTLHTEIKIGGEWHHYGCPSFVRIAEVYAKMAGRCSCAGITQLVPPHGLPEDISAVTRFELEEWEPKTYSAGWLCAAEIHYLIEFIDNELHLEGHDGATWCDVYFGLLFGESFGTFWKHDAPFPASLQDVRFVFWFDS